MAEAQVTEAPVERVELFEDRASVTRRVTVAPGRHELAIEGVSPLVDERHLSFPTGDVVVEEARVERWRVTRADADPAEAARLADRRDVLRDAVVAAEAVVARARDAAARAEARVEAGLRWVPEVLLRGRDAGGFVAAVREVAERRVADAETVADHEHAVEDLRRELADVEARLEEARRGTVAWRCRLRLRVLATRAGPFSVRYTIPCALWRPVHRATLSKADARVAWEVGAMVWNATGEDWRGVALVCSTARPGGHADPPTLLDDVVRTRRRDREVVVEARDEAVHVAREGRTAFRRDVPGVDDGGEPRTFTAPHPVDLPSDGRPVHVRLEDWTSSATLAWVAHPERSGAVVLRTRQPNGGTRPLLAGPVELYGDHGAVGRGKVGFVAPGEAFTLGWGSHDAVRVTRRSTRKDERSRLTGWQTYTFEVALRVANLGDEAVTVDVRERVPVGEIAELRVGAPTASPPCAGPDGDGLCTWRLALAARETRDVTLTFTVEAPATVRLPF